MRNQKKLELNEKLMKKLNANVKRKKEKKKTERINIIMKLS
jgi:hypothetical protein